MKSIRSRLAGAIRRDLALLEREVERALFADAAGCRGVLRDFCAWLDGTRGTPGRPPDPRIRTFVLERLKESGWFDRQSRFAQRRSVELLDTFFGLVRR